MPTYTNIWRIEKKLYKLYDFRLPQPVSVVYIGVLVGVGFVWVVLLQLIGVPVEIPLHVVYIVPPFVIAFLATRPVVEGKRLTELVSSQARFLAEPRVYTRLRPDHEPGTVEVTVRVWHRHPEAGPLPEVAAAADMRERSRVRGPRRAKAPQSRPAAAPVRTADQAPPLAEALPHAPERAGNASVGEQERAPRPLWDGEAAVRSDAPPVEEAPERFAEPAPALWREPSEPEHGDSPDRPAAGPEAEPEAEPAAAAAPDPAARADAPVRRDAEHGPAAEPAAEGRTAATPASAAESAPPDLRREWEWDYGADRAPAARRGVGVRILNYFGFALHKAPERSAQPDRHGGEDARPARTRGPRSGPIPGAARTPAQLAEHLAAEEKRRPHDRDAEPPRPAPEPPAEPAAEPTAADRAAGRATARRRAEEMMAARLPADSPPATARDGADAAGTATGRARAGSSRDSAASGGGPQRRLRGRAQGMQVARKLERERSVEATPQDPAETAAPAARAEAERGAGSERARERVRAPKPQESAPAAGAPAHRPSLRERRAQRRPHAAPWDLPVPLESADSPSREDAAQGPDRPAPGRGASPDGPWAADAEHGDKPSLQLDHGTDEHESLSEVVRVFSAPPGQTAPGAEAADRSEHDPAARAKADETAAFTDPEDRPGAGSDSDGERRPAEAAPAPVGTAPSADKPSLQLDHGTDEHESLSEVVRVFSAPPGKPDERPEPQESADAPTDGSGEGARAADREPRPGSEDNAAAAGRSADAPALSASGDTDASVSGGPSGMPEEQPAAPQEAEQEEAPAVSDAGSAAGAAAASSTAQPPDHARREDAGRAAEQADRSEGPRVPDDRMAVLDRHLNRTDTPPPPQPRFAEAGSATPRRPVAWFTDAPGTDPSGPDAEGLVPDPGEHGDGSGPDAAVSAAEPAGDRGPAEARHGGGPDRQAAPDAAEDAVAQAPGTEGAVQDDGDSDAESARDRGSAEARHGDGRDRRGESGPAARHGNAESPGGPRSVEPGPADAAGVAAGAGTEPAAEPASDRGAPGARGDDSAGQAEPGSAESRTGRDAESAESRSGGEAASPHVAEAAAAAPGTDGVGPADADRVSERAGDSGAAESRSGGEAASPHVAEAAATAPESDDAGQADAGSVAASARHRGVAEAWRGENRDRRGESGPADGAAATAPGPDGAGQADGDPVADPANARSVADAAPGGAASSVVMPAKPPLELDHGTGEHESFGQVDAPQRRTTAADLEAAEAAAIRARRGRPQRADTDPSQGGGEQQSPEQRTAAASGTDQRDPHSSGAPRQQEPAASAAPDADRSDRLARAIRANPAAGSPDAGAEASSTAASADAPASGTGAPHGAPGPSGAPSTQERPDRRAGTASTGGRPVRSAPPGRIDDGVFSRVAQNARRLSHLFGQTPPGIAPEPPPRADGADTREDASAEPATAETPAQSQGSDTTVPAETDKPELQLDHGTGEQQRLGAPPAGAPAPRPRPAQPARTGHPGESGATRGWRRLARVVTGGQAPAKTDLPAGDIERLRTPLQAPRSVVVLGCTGGAGQTVTTLMLGHTLAAYRDERVVAVDVNPGGGGLSRRVRTETPESLTSLLANADAVHSYAGIRRYTSRTATGLEVVAALDDPYVQTLDDRDYAGLGGLLERFYEITVLDPAATGVARALPAADGMVLVAPASEDAARAVAMTFEWLDGHGYAALRSTAVVVINGVSKRSLADVDAAEQVARGRCRAIVRVPWDDHLAADKVVDVNALRPTTRRAHGALGGVLLHGLEGAPAGPGAPGGGRRRTSESRR
nr:TcpE family conjugal transfer membrane protein [Streptomonospora sp. PA3]